MEYTTGRGLGFACNTACFYLAGLHKVHPAYRIVNARRVGGRAGVFNRVPTLCNQLLPQFLADILQTLHNCYGHIEDVHGFGHFSKNFHVVELGHFSSMFCIDSTYVV
jgi:hypothetical protein